jgi:hypothetical protein
MRKIIINPKKASNIPSPELNFLDLEPIAQLELTSEAQEYPAESALLLSEDASTGWQAACAGEQTIRILFDQPQSIEHIFLVFDEQEKSRTQEFVLLWLMDKEDSYREILRQQYHFSPPNTTREIEHYEVCLTHLKALELKIIPDITGGDACAKLKQLRLA